MRPDIILCRPQHSGNIGFTARAMKTMGLSNLVIVTNKALDLKAARPTATNAAHLLSRVRIYTDLVALLPKYHFLVAFTARSRKFRNHLLLCELPALLQHQSAQAKVGFVFGRESSGLTNKEIESCQCVVTIPTSCSFHSLNLSHAVQVACYEIVRAQHQDSATPLNGSRARTTIRKTSPATAMEREAVFAKLEKASEKIGLRVQDAEKIAKIFRTLLEERQLGKREAGGLHRFLDQIIHRKP